jgi:trigger factor
VDFDVRPEIDLKRLGGFQIHRTVPAVSDEAVDRVIERLREQHATWHPLNDEPPVLGDMGVVEITPMENGVPGAPRRYQIFLGEGQVRPEIEERIRTLKPGEQGEFDIDLPENADDPNSVLKTHHLRVHLVEARRPELPVVDDEFAKATAGFNTVAEFRENVRAGLEREAESQADQDARRQLIDQILQANPFDVPPSMVDRYLEQMIQPRKGEEQSRVLELRQAARPAAEQALRRMLVIDRVANLEALHATSDELDSRYEELGERYGRSAREIRAQLKKEGREHEVEETLTEDKVFRYLESLSTIE